MATTKKSTKTTSSAKDVVGLQVSGISKMQTGINTYVKNVKGKINIGVSNATIAKAVKGTNSVNTLKQLTHQIDTRIENYLTALEQFSKQLDQVKASYGTADKNNTVFSTQATKIKNS